MGAVSKTGPAAPQFWGLPRTAWRNARRRRKSPSGATPPSGFLLQERQISTKSVQSVANG
jgi:hypothetical protein